MARWIPEEYQDYLLDKIAECDNQAMCSQQPTTYYNAVRPNMWLADTVYIAGDLVRPPVSNGFIYECTIGGTSGSGVPGWGTAQDQTFSDNTVTWKTHANYALVNTTRVPADYTIEDYDQNGVVGRIVRLAEKMGVITHTAGIIAHCALTCSVDKTLRYVTPAQTTIGNNNIDSGRTTIFYELRVVVADPLSL